MVEPFPRVRLRRSIEYARQLEIAGFEFATSLVEQVMCILRGILSDHLSGLGLGITAPFMNTAFVFSGLLILAGVVGIFQGIREMGALARWSCTVLLALSPLGMAVDGIFTLESFLPHMVGFLMGIASPVLSFVVIGLLLRRVQGWRRFGSWLLLASPLTLVLLVLFFLTFSPTVAGTQTGVAGLTERILAVEVQAWFVAMGWLAFRRR